MSTACGVSVVVATRDRAGRLEALLAALERQSIGPDAFEVIVVDDGSTDGTPQVLATAEARTGLALRTLRHPLSLGPAFARNAGWRAARSPLIAFTDDDCEPDDRWLEHGLAAWHEDESAIIQGRTGPIPGEAHRLSPFARTILVEEPGPPWETCNIFFPRAVLEALGGFDTDELPILGGEDTDLAWRAVCAGVSIRFVPSALVHHAVVQEGVVGMLRYAWRWQRAVPVFARHPQLRRRHLHHRVFWSQRHERLVLAMVGLALPRRLRPLSLALAAPYLRHLLWRRTGPLLAPYVLLVDLVEMVGIVRAAIRHRTPMI